jgi:acyl transferase domain-containing protein
MEFIDRSTVLPEPATVDRTLAGDKVMPIAIVGVGGRFPGDASNPDKLWELLCHGGSAMTEVPKDRFNVDAFYHPQAERTGTQNFRGAHFMDRAPESFDAPFFSISPNEAKAMDPQQRMCLEVAYEAMENGMRILS